MFAGTSLNQNRFVRNFNGAVTSHVGPGEERLINRENPTALVDAFNSQSKASHVVAFVSPLRETFVLLTCATVITIDTLDLYKSVRAVGSSGQIIASIGTTLASEPSAQNVAV